MVDVTSWTTYSDVLYPNIYIYYLYYIHTKNPLAAPDWLTLTCTETRIETSWGWGWLPVKVDIVSFCVSLSAVISCVIGAAPSQARQSISQHHPDTASQG